MAGASMRDRMTELRVVARHRGFIHGRVYFDGRQSSVDCVIRGFTAKGARLEFSEAIALPETFEVFVPSENQHFQAQAVWRRGNAVGVTWMREVAAGTAADASRPVEPMADRLARLEREVAALRERLDALERE
jgi:hypothetical protein